MSAPSSPELTTATSPCTWTVDDVAGYLRIHHRSVIKMAERGEIPYLRLVNAPFRARQDYRPVRRRHRSER